MSIIKSISVGNGDMFYIKHNTDNFTIIDSYICTKQKEEIIKELLVQMKGVGITRFISTHPDEDHIKGLGYIDDEIGINNFYCVKNNTIKLDESDDFKRYCELRDSSKAYYISKDCIRKWMNTGDETRSSSGLSVLWPDVKNEDFIQELEKTSEGESPNNISAILQYSLENGAKVLWLGDMETDFLEKIESKVNWPEADIIFLPHHGRKSATIPKIVLDKISPKLLIIGEAGSDDINYYTGYETITQNSAKDITLDCVEGKVHFYVGSSVYKKDTLLVNEHKSRFNNYIGTLIL